jgi:hypothetical protein
MSTNVRSDAPSSLPTFDVSEIPSDSPSVMPFWQEFLPSEDPSVVGSDSPCLVATFYASEVLSDSPSLVPTAK